ncbi:MAG: hypothetical protein PQJ58_21780 [Spirochaetales bacterium]|nr:hypothetical protein [Spirochaetales bacterium]
MIKNDNASWEGVNALWIGHDSDRDVQNLYRRFLRSFLLEQAESFTLRITAVSQYQLFINGTLVDRGPAVSYQTLYYYDELIIPAEILRAGENRLAVLLFHDGEKTDTTQGFEYGAPGLLVQAGLPGGILVSDDKWKTSRSPLYSGESMVSKWGFYKEFYHEDKEDGWLSDDYDYSSWENVSVMAEALSKDFVQNLKKLETPRLEEIEMQPKILADVHRNKGRVSVSSDDCPVKWDGKTVELNQNGAGSAPAMIFDYETMVVGYPEIRVSSGFCIYEVWYGESLDMYRLDCIRTGTTGTWKAFQRRAYRYIQIRIIAAEGPVRLDYIGHRNSWYAYNKNALLEGSDKTINRILEVSRQTLRANTSYHFEDCPWREQALWVFDLRVMARINYHIYGNGEIVEKNIRQMFALQREDGSIPSTGPKENICNHIDFCYHLVGILREYYEFSGKIEVLKEFRESLSKLHTFLMNFRTDSGLMQLQGMPGWGVYLDWSTEIDKCGESVILNSLYLRYLDDLSFILSELGENDETYRREIAKLKPLVQDRLFSKEKGLFQDTVNGCQDKEHFSVQGNMAALYGGLASENVKQNILAMFDQPDVYPLHFGPSFYQIIFDALDQQERHKDILEQILRYWGGMLDRDAVTWWEVFDPDSPSWSYPHPFLGNTPTHEMDWIPISSCHGWSGAPAYAIPAYLLGVRLNELYRNRIVIRPGLPGYFREFQYELPLRGQMLKLLFKGDGRRYSIDIIEKPDDINIIIEQ